MARINSALGPVDTENLGPTMMHEHILIANWAMRQAFSNWINREEFVDYAVKMVKKAKHSGIRTIVDCTPINLGRDIHVIQEVAEKAEMQIIACTGFYHFEEMWIRDRDPRWLADLLINEVEHGIMGTDCKPGILKCATDIGGLTPANRHLMEVVSIVHKATGLPITTHATVANRVGLEQQSVFEELGVDISKVIIGHCGDSTDADFISSIIDRGSYVGMDRFGIDWMLPQAERIKVVAKLCRLGYAGKMVLSCDHSAYIDYAEEKRGVVQDKWAETRSVPVEEREVQFSYLMDTVVPQLREQGVSEEDISLMLVENPRRFFEGKP